MIIKRLKQKCKEPKNLAIYGPYMNCVYKCVEQLVDGHGNICVLQVLVLCL